MLRRLVLIISFMFWIQFGRLNVAHPSLLLPVVKLNYFLTVPERLS